MTDYDPKRGRQIAKLAETLHNAANKVDAVFMLSPVSSKQESEYADLQGELEDLRTDVHNVLTGHAVDINTRYLEALEHHKPCHSTPACINAGACVEYTRSGWGVDLKPVITDLGDDDTCPWCGGPVPCTGHCDYSLWSTR